MNVNCSSIVRESSSNSFTSVSEFADRSTDDVSIDDKSSSIFVKSMSAKLLSAKLLSAKLLPELDSESLSKSSKLSILLSLSSVSDRCSSNSKSLSLIDAAMDADIDVESEARLSNVVRSSSILTAASVSSVKVSPVKLSLVELSLANRLSKEDSSMDS